MSKDPVCGMLLDDERAAAAVSHRGETFLFCSLACRDRFVGDPERFATPPDPRGDQS